MSDSNAGGVVAGILVMGAVGWLAEAIAVMLLVSAAAVIVIGILAVVALVFYFSVLAKAISEKKWDWVFDQFAAPLVGGMVGLGAYHLFVPLANHIGTITQAHPRHLTVGDLVLIGVVYVVFIASVFGAPILAISIIIGAERPVRFLAYPLLALACSAWFLAELGHTSIFS